MNQKAWPCLPLALSLSLLAGGCSRRAAPARGPESSADARQDHPVAGASTTPPGLTDPSVLQRVSPFGEPHPAEQQAAPLPASESPAKARAAAPQRAARVIKPFTPPRPPAASKTETPLPAVPALALTAPQPLPLPAFAAPTGPVATASYEPARPNTLERVIHKLPGLRRRPEPGSNGFVPPRPVHEIQFVLPPGGLAVLGQNTEMDLKASVDASGRVTRVELVRPRDEELLTLAAYAASHWSFSPAQVNGEAVPGQVLLHFRLDQSSAPGRIVSRTKRRPADRDQ